MLRPNDSVRATALVLFAGLTILSCVHPPYPEQLPLQHIPTVIVLVALWTSTRLNALSRRSFFLILGYLSLHVIGARYIYSYVPYDEWCKNLFGTTLSSIFGWKRNNYDRIVHFSYGLLIFYPVREVILRYTRSSRTFANYVALEFVFASSMLYELFEWFIAIVLSPGNAEAYNGQQGDMWDAQKDMALAALGAVVALLIILIRQRQLRSREAILNQ